MLRWRLPLGILLIAAFVGLCWLDTFSSPPPGLWLVPLALLVSVLASAELLDMLAARGLRPLPAVVYGGNLLVVASNVVPFLWPKFALPGPLYNLPAGALAYPLLALTLGVLWALAGEMHRYEKPGGVVVQLALAIFALVYVGLLLSFLVQIRMLGGDERDGGKTGMGLFVALIATVKLGDIGAYTVGRLFGRHKLAPLISPGKTVEGAVGGLAFSCFGAWLAFEWVMPRLTGSSAPASHWGWLVFGIVVGLAGMLGDLAESLVKRDLGCKDSSTWLPGFGGVLDLVDSLLVAAPVAYVCWTAGLVR